MADQIFGGHDFGDPDNSDPRFNMENMLSTVAQNDLNDLREQLELHMIKRLCGPKTLAYYEGLKYIANAQLAWGNLPPKPASLDD
ncbi:hypothetical protein GS501_04485 [Saccharibacter sp. 17.LH.SD]|uniref:hypothetical protein n=1 Tax=Saccharibacter sp. 17.LH.SD TaxID=2689393 RepID=UPI00136D5DB2|nr:hypothetical protein [Saccharibacter sp. 17.LH.SD]MXV44303.1 hypothetical protein [Saccharibacter sp. 17.LH.SD]